MDKVKVLIVEDEPLAAKRLEQLVTDHADYLIVKRADSVKSAIDWLSANQPDLAFFDIQLADGLSFEIFNRVDVRCPIIFTTAFDEYALRAFKVNSIDYLLKPINKEELGNSLQKYEANFSQKSNLDITAIQNVLQQLQRTTYKERFILRVGEHLKSLRVSDICFVASEDKATYATDTTGKRYIIDQSLDEIQQQLDPQLFFRISRKYLVHIESFTDIIAYSNSRLKLALKHCNDNAVIVSRERVNDFKAWLDR